MPRFPSLSLTLAVLGLTVSLGGCDRESGGGAQQAADSPIKPRPGLPGEIDRGHKGSLAPTMGFMDPDRKIIELHKLKDTPTLLNLWATWCAPCVIEMPQLDKLADDYKGKLRVVTLSQDMQGAAKVTPFFAARKFRHLEPWLDPENAAIFHYGGGTLPLTILYDADGREVWRIAGGYDWSTAEAKALIEEGMEK